MKTLIQKLKQIKDYCSKHDKNCHNCIYANVIYCDVQESFKYMRDVPPAEWDIEWVEEKLNGNS